ncbi:MAG TPA: hypothetical protein VNJ12_10930 [Candidatus Dormibacteraeota bacterium]|nr:hypothetical protein [Candidatus Dormibacteraeota bacterium]
MPLSCKPLLCACAAIFFVLALAPAKARAQTDEIQVYDATIARRGIFNVTLHNNFTPIGRTTPAYPGAIIPNHSWNGGVEWAYGVKTWWEQGLYLPIYTAYSDGRGGSIDGFKIRELFVRPHADRHTLFYGLNFEFSFNYGYWESRTESGEMRPIVGVNLHNWELVYNPIVDTDYTGGLGGLQYNPGGMVKYNFNNTWSLAAEEFDGFGPFNGFATLHNQFHEVWAMVDHNSNLVDVEAGVGVGVTAGSDRLTLKLMLSRDLNKTPIRF